MEITININDWQLNCILNKSAEELRRQDPDLEKDWDKNYAKLIGLLNDTIKSQNELSQICDALADCLSAMKMTQSKIGVHAGMNIAKGKIEILG